MSFVGMAGIALVAIGWYHLANRGPAYTNLPPWEARTIPTNDAAEGLTSGGGGGDDYERYSRITFGRGWRWWWCYPMKVVCRNGQRQRRNNILSGNDDNIQVSYQKLTIYRISYLYMEGGTGHVSWYMIYLFNYYNSIVKPIKYMQNRKHPFVHPFPYFFVALLSWLKLVCPQVMLRRQHHTTHVTLLHALFVYPAAPLMYTQFVHMAS